MRAVSKLKYLDYEAARDIRNAIENNTNYRCIIKYSYFRDNYSLCIVKEDGNKDGKRKKFIF